MFEYKSEVLSIQMKPKGIKVVKTIVDLVDTAKLDKLINEKAAEGWELVTHSSIVDTIVGHINTIVTFRRAK